MLLEAQADPNIADSEGYAPLHVATGFGVVPFMKILLEAKADPFLKAAGEVCTTCSCVFNDSMTRLQTPLGIARGMRQPPEVTKLLVEATKVRLSRVFAHQG